MKLSGSKLIDWDNLRDAETIGPKNQKTSWPNGIPDILSITERSTS